MLLWMRSCGHSRGIQSKKALVGRKSSSCLLVRKCSGERKEVKGDQRGGRERRKARGKWGQTSLTPMRTETTT